MRLQLGTLKAFDDLKKGGEELNGTLGELVDEFKEFRDSLQKIVDLIAEMEKENES